MLKPHFSNRLEPTLKLHFFLKKFWILEPRKGKNTQKNRLTAVTFKGRYCGHNRSFNIREAKQTTLSRHCSNLKDKKIPFDRKWTILTHPNHTTLSQRFVDCVWKKSSTSFTNQRQLHSIKRMKFLDGVSIGNTGHFRTLEEQNFFFLALFLLLTSKNTVL